MQTIISHNIAQVAKIIKAGGIVAYPTEAVFGLGCDPLNQQAVQHLLQIKQRPEKKGLILISSHFDQLSDYLLPLSEDLKRRVLPTWPGPVTWLLPKSRTSPSWISGQYETIATRISKHPSCQLLCQSCGYPITSTSANPAGLPPAKTIKDVFVYFDGKIDAIYDADIGQNNTPTEIRDGLTGKIIRKG